MKIIGIDIGTTSISSVVLDGETKTQVSAKTLPNDTAHAGHSWERMQDADRILEKCRKLVMEYRREWPDVRVHRYHGPDARHAVCGCKRMCRLTAYDVGG